MSYKFYHFPDAEPINDQYSVEIDEHPISVYNARVSAMPFNRCWPGHQRSKDQTEIAGFVMFGMDAPVTVKITPSKAFSQAIIRPQSRQIVPNVSDGSISITISSPGQYTLELDGTHEALHIFADPIKELCADRTSDNVIYFGPGLHDVGLMELHSNETIYIDEGAIVFGCIRATNATNIKILGHGILDSSQIHEKILYETETADGWMDVLNAEREGIIVLKYCTDVVIEGITLRDPLFLALRPIACSRVTIDNVKIIGCWRYNSDGIDFINSTDSVVRNCFVRSYDDSICLKGFYFTYQGEMFNNGITHDLMDNVVIENCVVWNDWGKALEVGVDVCAKAIRNCVFRNCDVIHGTGVMIDVSSIDYAEIYDIRFEDIRLEYDDVMQIPTIQTSDAHSFPYDPDSQYLPAAILSSIAYSPNYSHGGVVRSKIHDLTFKDIQINSSRMPPIIFAGYDPEHMVKGVTIDGLSFNGQRISSEQDANIEKGPFVENVLLI